MIFHICVLKVSANVKLAMQCLEIFGGNAPNANPPLIARLVQNIQRIRRVHVE